MKLLFLLLLAPDGRTITRQAQVSEASLIRYRAPDVATSAAIFYFLTDR